MLYHYAKIGYLSLVDLNNFFFIRKHDLKGNIYLLDLFVSCMPVFMTTLRCY
jgi:hypothetical protein